jgi:lipopolysaccharide transport system permease protein
MTDSALSDLPVTRLTPARGWSHVNLRELRDYRELVLFLVWRDVKVRYKQTTLGVAWALIQPLLTMMVFAIIFGRIAKLPSDGVPYPLFALAGLLPWQMFAASLTGSANSLVGSAGLVTKVYFPRLVIPLASVAGTLVDFAIAFALLLAMMAYYRVAPTANIVFLPLFVAWALAAAFGVGLWFSALNVRYRDVQYVLPFLMQVWLFASPVAYSASLITSPTGRIVYGLNPMAAIVQGFRWVLLGAAPPGAWMWVSAAMTVLVVAGGVVFFKRMEDTFADVI